MMGKEEKLLSKLRNANNTFPWSDLVTLMARLGYDMQKTGGSRVRFYNAKTGHMLRLHKPHPENYIKGGALKDVRTVLKQEGFL